MFQKFANPWQSKGGRALILDCIGFRFDYECWDLVKLMSSNSYTIPINGFCKSTLGKKLSLYI